LNRRQILVVFTTPVQGMEDQYNDWYDNVHLPEILGRGTMISAQRYKLGELQRNEDPPFQYMAIYELKSGGAAADTEASRSAPPSTPTSTIDRTNRFSFYFTEHGPKVWAVGEETPENAS
jgi:hypothetical protein